MSGKWNNPHLEALLLQDPVAILQFLAQSEIFVGHVRQISHFELKNAKRAPIFKLTNSGVFFYIICHFVEDEPKLKKKSKGHFEIFLPLRISATMTNRRRQSERALIAINKSNLTLN